MPRKPLKPCGYPGCPDLTSGRYCPRHQCQVTKAYNQTQRPHQHLYDNTRWRRLRRRLLARQPLCAECEREGRITPATVADHIVPHEGDPALFWDENNLQALCKTCHDRKTAREGRWGKKDVAYKYRLGSKRG